MLILHNSFDLFAETSFYSCNCIIDIWQPNLCDVHAQKNANHISIHSAAKFTTDASSATWEANWNYIHVHRSTKHMCVHFVIKFLTLDCI